MPNSIATHIAAQHSATLPFNIDYKQLNNLRFYQQLFNQIDAQHKDYDDLKRRLEEATTYFTDQFEKLLFDSDLSFSPWFDQICNTYIDETMQLGKEPTSPEFVAFLLHHSQHYFPKTYYCKSIETAKESMAFFPGSIENRSNHFNAHIEPHPDFRKTGRLISSAAPQIQAHRANLGRATVKDPYVLAAENEELDHFFHMQMEENVTRIVVLGDSQKRINYTGLLKINDRTAAIESVVTDEFIATPTCIAPEIEIVDKPTNDMTTVKVTAFTLTRKSDGKTQNIEVTHIPVQDNAALSLNHQNLESIYDAYQHYQSNTALIHCDSGVGRTGQLKLLFNMLDQVQVDPALQAAVLFVIQTTLDDEQVRETNKQSDEPLKAALNYIYAEMRTNLVKLRQTRFSIQTSIQFEHALTPLLLLIHYQMSLTKLSQQVNGHHANAHPEVMAQLNRELDQLREHFEQDLTGSVTLKTSVHEVVDGPILQEEEGRGEDTSSDDNDNEHSSATSALAASASAAPLTPITTGLSRQSQLLTHAQFGFSRAGRPLQKEAASTAEKDDSSTNTSVNSSASQ